MAPKTSKKVEKAQVKDKAEESFYASPLYDFLYPFKPAGSQWLPEYLIVLFVVIIRCAIGLGPYSGKSTKPLHGDFEAQRHWMEITEHLPISQWYFFDLKYWGLDYPPLTAYHSYILGRLGSLINPDWFALNASRGLESNDLKTYMRFTVILSEVIFYIPAVVYFTKWVGKHRGQSPIGQFIAAAAILFQPALMLIDHGHFQYNCVMLGFTVYAINSLMDEFYGPAAACFVLSICFKQMALYYSPIFFAYLLGRSVFKTGIHIPRFLSIGITTIATLLVIYIPLYIKGGGLQNISQSIHRIFPFARGIFEDKVANFWCVTNVFVKYKVLFTQQQLQLYSLVATTVGFLPAVLLVLLYPKKHLIPFALAACSMSFFLFSFQVHEKTILVPLLPITLLYTSTNWDVLSLVSWINNVGLFTLWPLLKKDGLVLQYYVCFAFCNWLIGNFSFVTPTFLPKFLTPGPSVSSVDSDYRRRSLLPRSILWKVAIIGSYVAMGVTHFLDMFVVPPPNYPDLWVILNCTIGFSCFALFWLWNYYKLFTLSRGSLQQL